jgi:hypothetical protein
MALSRKLNKTDKVTPSVEELILKGGTSGQNLEEDSKDSQDEDEIKRVQLRIPQPKLDQMDEARRKRPGKLSRHTWIMEAIEEKLLQDETSS